MFWVWWLGIFKITIVCKSRGNHTRSGVSRCEGFPSLRGSQKLPSVQGRPAESRSPSLPHTDYWMCSKFKTGFIFIHCVVGLWLTNSMGHLQPTLSLMSNKEQLHWDQTFYEGPTSPPCTRGCHCRKGRWGRWPWGGGASWRPGWRQSRRSHPWSARSK